MKSNCFCLRTHADAYRILSQLMLLRGDLPDEPRAGPASFSGPRALWT